MENIRFVTIQDLKNLNEIEKKCRNEITKDCECVMKEKFNECRNEYENLTPENLTQNQFALLLLDRIGYAQEILNLINRKEN